MSAELTGVEQLRRTVALLNNCNETFNDRYTAAELMRLGEMYRACAWDFAPDRWEGRQLAEALCGIVPQWDENERPVYTKRPR